MASFIDSLERFVNEEAEKIRNLEAAEAKAMAREERRALDEEQAYELARREATANRSTTLSMAWAAATLLQQENVSPKSWISTIPTFKTVGRIFKRGVLGSEKRVVLEGWPLLAWRDDRHYEGRDTHVLVLTPEDQSEGNHGIHLAHYRQQNSIYDVSYSTNMLPTDVQSLQREPMAEGDMLWPRGWKRPLVESSEEELAMVRLTHYEETYLLSEHHYGPAPDFAAYNKLPIENSIQKAIARVAARHLVVNPAKALTQIAKSYPQATEPSV